ncbi:Uncharacterized protein APZ42_007660, partial [Daphnia magna]
SIVILATRLGLSGFRDRTLNRTVDARLLLSGDLTERHVQTEPNSKAIPMACVVSNRNTVIKSAKRGGFQQPRRNKQTCSDCRKLNNSETSKLKKLLHEANRSACWYKESKFDRIQINQTSKRVLAFLAHIKHCVAGLAVRVK